MAFDLPRLPMVGLTDEAFQIYWQKVVEAIEAQETSQDQLIADLTAAQADIAAAQAELADANVRIKIGLSYTDPSLVVSAVDDGAGNSDITIIAHRRYYGDGSFLDVSGGALNNRNLNTDYGIYYVDATLADTTPTYQSTTALQQAQNNYSDGRHFVAIIHTPAAAGAPTSGGTTPPGSGGGTVSGGSYTGGSGGGGVIP